MRIGVIQRSQIEGWGFSLFLHGILLSAMLPMFRQLPAPIHPEPFRWNVTLVESPRQATEVEPASDASFANEFLQTAAAVEQNPVPSMPQPTNQLNETIKESSGAKPERAALPPADLTQTQQETSPPTPSMTEPTPVAQETLPVPREAAEQPKPFVAAAPIPSEPSAPVAARGEQERPPTPAPSTADTTMAPVQSLDLPPASPASVLPTASSQSSAPRADYSWLQQAVSRRLEELKRSSRPSLEDASRHKVMVKAVVSSAGELMEAEVVKSSGLDRIDQEAMALVQRAFPMQLDRTLDRRQIVMRIPITYSRD